MKVRRYLRGSGRVLAFVFIASVIWLLFDMAALRLSINDVNGQLLKERVIREREILKQQSRVTELMKRGFKHPVQRVEMAVTKAGKGPLSAGINLAQVYRKGGKKQDQMLGDKRMDSLHHQGDDPLKNDLVKQKEGATQQNAAPKQDVAARKKTVNLDMNETNLERSKVIDSSNKILLPVAASNTTQVHPGVQENKHAPPPTSKNGPVKAEDVVIPNKSDSKNSEKVKEELKTKTVTKAGQLQAQETHPVQTTLKSPNKDVNRKEVKNNTEEKHVRTIAKSDLSAAQETMKPAIKLGARKDSEHNSTAVRKPGVHKVLSLDVTHAPRDANAVGQFGQAALVGSDEDAEVRRRWDEGHFNVYLSDKIPVDRAIPDTRPEM